MAETLSRAQLDQARQELAEANRRLGFRQSESSTAPSGGSDGPKANEPSAPAPDANSTQAESGGETAGTTPQDPGPPRFIGVDIEHKLAGLSGGAVIPVSDGAVSKIVVLLLKELRTHMAANLAAVAATHAQSGDPSQLEIPFGKPD